jgi:hypothetical protein
VFADPSPTMHRELINNIRECPATPEQWDRLLSKSLAGTDFDLMVHSNSYPPQTEGNRANSEQTPTSL